MVELARLIIADQDLPLHFFDFRAKIKHELFETAPARKNLISLQEKDPDNYIFN